MDNQSEERQMFDATCAECGQATQVPFQPTEGRPVYCRDCFQKNKPKRNFDRPREMHNVTCAECGAETQVPFEPKEGRPVYCRDCFAKQRD